MTMDMKILEIVMYYVILLLAFILGIAIGRSDRKKK